MCPSAPTAPGFAQLIRLEGFSVVFAWLTYAVPSIATAQSAVILNEYNAVDTGKHLDENGSDTHFGRAAGNGGRWIELVITGDKLDLRGAELIWRDEDSSGTLTLADQPLWQSLPRGTIVTLLKGDLPSDVSVDPEKGDYWVHVNTSDRRYVAGGALQTSNNDYTLTIAARDGTILFGPVGEGAPNWPGGGVNSREVGALIADPSPRITAANGYDDMKSSTFGAPNRWLQNDESMVQDFAALRGGASGIGDDTARAALERRAQAARRFEVKRLATVDVPGWTAEIVGYCPRQKLVVATNPIWNTLDLFAIEDLARPAELTPLDFDEEELHAQGLWTIHEPTSVAIHPRLPVALVAVLGQEYGKPGRLMAFGLRDGETRGDWLVNQEVGDHPDCVVISPDSRWAVVANEGEALSDTVGSVTFVDLAGLTLGRHPARDGDLPAQTLTGLGRTLETSDGDVEPEFAAFDPRSRFVVVSCQENNALLLIDTTKLDQQPPRVDGVVWLPDGAEPDGVAVIDNIKNPDGKTGCLIAAAEEGKFDRYGRQLGQALSLTWVDPDNLAATPVPLSRSDVRPLVDPDKPWERRDPESVLLRRVGGRVLCFLTIERGDYLLTLDVTDPTQPLPVARTRVGDRPEGLIAVPHQRGLILITGDEGNRGPGTISFVSVQPTSPGPAPPTDQISPGDTRP